MFRLTLKELFAKKLRLITTALAVMLGVAFMSGTLVLTDTMSRSFDGLFSDAYAGTDAFVRGVSPLGDHSAGAPSLDAGIVATVAAADGVAHAEGLVSGYAQLVDHDGKAIGNPGQGAPTLGDAWIDSPELNPYHVVEGRPPASNGEIVVDRRSAETADFVLGEAVTVLTKSGSDVFTITGIAKFGEEDSIGGASQVLFTDADAQQFVGEPDQFDAVSVVAVDGYTEAQVAAAIATAVPSDAEVLTGSAITKESQDDTKEGLAFFNTFLLVFAGIALFVGAFIIFNTFSIIITQRQKEMALLRAIGASGKQVVRSVLVEAAVVGAIASATGLAVGIGVATALQSLLNSMGFDLPAGGLAITSSTVITSLAVGTGITLASAYLPARRAGRVPPIAAMRSVAHDTAATSRTRMIAGGLVTAGSVGAMVAGLNSAAIAVVGAGAFGTFIGVAVLAPVIALPAARLLGLPASTMTRMTGSLARQNAMRNPKRTAATAAALMIGVALVGFIATFAASTKESINGAVDHDFRGDFVLDSGAFGAQGGLSHTLATDLAGRPEFAAVTSFRGVDATVDGREDFVQSWDTATMQQLVDVDPKEGDITALGSDGVAVEDGYAKEFHLAIGSTMHLTFAQGEADLTVRAIFGDPTWSGAVFFDHQVLNSLGADPLDAMLYIKTADGADKAAAEALLNDLTKDYPTADVLDREGFKENRSGQIDLILNLIYALLALAIVIALMGITNTLALSIFERTRELGLLRAIGMTRQQLKATVRFEAVIIALFGTLLGLGLGLFFGWSIVNALADDGLGDLVIPVPTLAVVTTVAALAGIAASVLPGRRAAKLDVLEAIASQ
jgi:putative ABC transport system permease protein